MTLRNLCVPLVTLVLVGACTRASQAVMLYWTPNRATTPPQYCQYADSGWQYQGRWGDFLGTPIASQYFITARHIGGSIGQTFTYNNQAYTTTAFYDSPTTDLRIWRVSSPFSTYAPLFTTSNEVGQTMTVFGRGTQRGSPVIISGEQRGWFWGASDHVQSWGSNIVTSIADGGAEYGELLYFTFDPGGDWFESHLSVGDSGGAVFIKDSGIWKLAGINLAVDGPYSLTGQNGTGFNAALYDAGGLYAGGDDNWTYIPDQPAIVPAGSYSTRISANLPWIYSITGPVPTVPEPASLMLALLGAWTIHKHARNRRGRANQLSLS